MCRWRAAAVGLTCLVTGGIAALVALVLPSAAGASGVTVRVSPDRDLVDGQTVTVSGRGLARTDDGKPLTWFVVECNAAVRHRLNPSTDTSHCDVTDAKRIHVEARGTFRTRFVVETGIVGDGYCGTEGHDTCVVAVSEVQGQGTVVRIEFKSPLPVPAPVPAPATGATSTTG